MPWSRNQTVQATTTARPPLALAHHQTNHKRRIVRSTVFPVRLPPINDADHGLISLSPGACVSPVAQIAAHRGGRSRLQLISPALLCSFFFWQNACRKQKMKCTDADNPPCKRCRHAGIECIFEKPIRDTQNNSEQGMW